MTDASSGDFNGCAASTELGGDADRAKYSAQRQTGKPLPDLRSGGTLSLVGMRKTVTRKKVLTTGDVARICQVAPRTVSKWFDTGALKGYRVPGSRDRRIPIEDLIRFMQNNGMPLRGLTGAVTNVLIASNDDELAATMADILNQHLAIEAETVRSAFAAGVVAAQTPPDVMIVDANVNDFRRAEFCSAAREQESLRNTRLVAIASDATDASALRASGFDACLIRPVSRDALLSAVESPTRR
jgi:CheY-like chemotaxis protein